MSLKKNIKTIIIEDNYSLTTIEDLKKIAPNNLNIIFNFNHKKNVPFGFHFIKVKDFLYFLLIGLNLKRGFLINKKSWKETQIKHSIWDSALVMIKDGFIKPNRFQLIKSSISCYLKYIRGLYISNLRIRAAFLGHTVYTTRSLIVGLNGDNDIEIFVRHVIVFINFLQIMIFLLFFSL